MFFSLITLSIMNLCVSSDITAVNKPYRYERHFLPITNTESRPYLNWMRNGIKTAAGGVNGPVFQCMQIGHLLTLGDRESGLYISGRITEKNRYLSFREMLEMEGVSNMLPFLKHYQIEDAIRIYNNFPNSGGVENLGCVAIKINILRTNIPRN